jgi:hypothetical protein
MVLSMIVIGLWAQAPGCTKDTDCKGERICEAGVCVEPKSTTPVAAPPPPPPPPVIAPVDAAAYPKVVRREGQVCVQSLEADGRVSEACRAETPVRVRTGTGSASSYSLDPAPRPPRPRAEPSARFVASFLLHGGLLLLSGGGSTVALGELGTTLALGGRFRSGVGVGGLVNLTLSPTPVGPLFLGTLGPALRFGDRSHFLLCVGSTVTAYSFGSAGSGAGLAGSLIATGVFAVSAAFGFNLHSALHVDASGVVFTVGAGIGFGAF